MYKYGYKIGKCPFRYARGNRQADPRRCRARTVPLFRISVGFGAGRVLVTARSAALVSRLPHIFMDTMIRFNMDIPSYQ